MGVTPILPLMVLVTFQWIHALAHIPTATDLPSIKRSKKTFAYLPELNENSLSDLSAYRLGCGGTSSCEVGSNHPLLEAARRIGPSTISFWTKPKQFSQYPVLA